MDYITPDETTDFRKAARDAARALTKDGHSALGDAVLDLWDEYQFALGRLAELEPSREVLVTAVTDCLDCKSWQMSTFENKCPKHRPAQPLGPLRATYGGNTLHDENLSQEARKDLQDRINASIATRRTIEARDSLGTPLRSCLECEREQRLGNDWALRCKKHRGEIRADGLYPDGPPAERSQNHGCVDPLDLARMALGRHDQDDDDE